MVRKIKDAVTLLFLFVVHILIMMVTFPIAMLTNTTDY